MSPWTTIPKAVPNIQILLTCVFASALRYSVLADCDAYLSVPQPAETEASSNTADTLRCTNGRRAGRGLTLLMAQASTRLNQEPLLKIFSGYSRLLDTAILSPALRRYLSLDHDISSISEVKRLLCLQY
jgi:hypothetical protein